MIPANHIVIVDNHELDQLDKDVFTNTTFIRKQYNESCLKLGIFPSKKLNPVIIGVRSVPKEGDK